jgi:glycosyltransferase involved in cell wall biosynthesis
MKLLVENTYKKADIVIAQTDEMKNELSELHGLDLKKIVVLMNPIDKYTINQSIQNIKNPFDKEFVNVVAAGRIIEQKGFDILIQAFKKVLKQNASFRLYIIGEDVVGQKQILLDYINSNNLQENIFFLGFQNNPYKFFYFSDLYVLSSRWEGLPNTVLENLYLKKPIVATNCIKTMESLIENGKNGLIVDVENVDDLADAILSYKTIDVSYQTIHFDSSDLINIFSIGDN